MILIVDDQRDLAHVLTRVLHYCGHESVAVHSAAEALDVLRVSRPDLMILDANMPDMDGLALLRRMKADEAMKDVPVVMYSADPREDKIIEARDLGALDYVIKGSTDIHSLVQRFCTTGSSSTPAAEAKESPTSPG